MTSSLRRLISRSTAAAARRCASLHSSGRSTKLSDALARGGMARSASAAVGPAGSLPLAQVGLLPIALPVVARADAVDRGRAGDVRRRMRIEHHRQFAAVPGVLDRRAQQPPVGGDRLVGLAEMLAGAVLNEAHRLA